MQRACQISSGTPDESTDSDEETMLGGDRRLAWFLDEGVPDLPRMVLTAGEAVDQQLR